VSYLTVAATVSEFVSHPPFAKSWGSQLVRLYDARNGAGALVRSALEQ